MKTIRQRYFEMDVADQVANHAMRLCDGLETQEPCATVLDKAYAKIRELEEAYEQALVLAYRQAMKSSTPHPDGPERKPKRPRWWPTWRMGWLSWARR